MIVECSASDQIVAGSRLTSGKKQLLWRVGCRIQSHLRLWSGLCLSRPFSLMSSLSQMMMFLIFIVLTMPLRIHSKSVAKSNTINNVMESRKLEMSQCPVKIWILCQSMDDINISGIPPYCTRISMWFNYPLCKCLRSYNKMLLQLCKPSKLKSYGGKCFQIYLLPLVVWYHFFI